MHLNSEERSLQNEYRTLLTIAPVVQEHSIVHLFLHVHPNRILSVFSIFGSKILVGKKGPYLTP